MITKIIFVLMALVSFQAFGSQHNKIDMLGMSKAGQFVAIEEYGYKASIHAYFVTVKIINVWTKEYVGSKVEVIEPASHPTKLSQARAKARKMAIGDLRKFKISG